jgi:hypothetical protein
MSLREFLDLDELRGATVVEEGGEKQVRMPYRVGCHNYALGVSLAFFMATTLLGYVILWEHHIPESVVSTAVPFFVAFSVVGFVVLGVAYLAPVRFYELIEEVDG